MNREDVQDLLDSQALSLLEEMHALGKRITRLEELLDRRASPTLQFSPSTNAPPPPVSPIPATSSQSSRNHTCGQPPLPDTPPTIPRAPRPSSSSQSTEALPSLLIPVVLGHICLHLVPCLYLFRRVGSVCKTANEFVSTQNKAAWSAMIAARCGEEHVVASVPKYIAHRQNRAYLYRLHLQPWTSMPEELYDFATIEQFLDDLETRDSGPTVHVQYIDRIGVVTRRRSPDSKPHTRLILALRMHSVGNNMRKREVRITLSVPLARSAQTHATPDIVKQKEFIAWPDEEMGYAKLMRTTEALIGRLRLHRVLPHQIEEAFHLVDRSKDKCGLAYTKIHAHAFALYGIHGGAHTCPIYIFSVDCKRLIARLPIFHRFEHTRLSAYGPFLFQTTRDGIDCYGPNAAMAFRLNTTDKIRWAHTNEIAAGSAGEGGAGYVNIRGAD